MKRRSLLWSCGSSSQISSRKSVPPSARCTAPILSLTAPVKAPFTWPKSSLSIRSRGMAAQLIGTNAPFFCLLSLWMASAQTSLPVPLSPVMKTVAELGAARSMVL